MKSIVSARLWQIPCIVLPLLSGCASFSLFGEREKPIVVETRAVERTRLNLPMPAPLVPRTTRWIIITPENAEQVWHDLREKNIDLVLFAVTDDGYEEMAVTMAEIRNFINLQRQIILKYREYYEPEPSAEK
jgi:hypothetical protein